MGDGKGNCGRYKFAAVFQCYSRRQEAKGNSEAGQENQCSAQIMFPSLLVPGFQAGSEDFWKSGIADFLLGG